MRSFVIILLVVYALGVIAALSVAAARRMPRDQIVNILLAVFAVPGAIVLIQNLPRSPFVVLFVIFALTFIGTLSVTAALGWQPKQIIRALLVVLAIPVAMILMLFTVAMVMFWPESRLKSEKYLQKHVVTGDQVQRWALKVLADPKNEQLKANYPGRLSQVTEGYQLHADIISNSPSLYVSVFWGARDWMAGFNVGPTNFVGDGHKWQDGVYFFYSH